VLKLYKTKNQLFECKISVEGADKSTAKPRLVLYPEKDSRNLFFEGVVENGICKIPVFPNVNFSAKGKAVLEVIVENSIIFQPWTSDYEIVTEQVKIQEARISSSPVVATVKILESDIKLDNKKIVDTIKSGQRQISGSKKNKSFDELLEEAAGIIQDNKIDDKKLLKAYNESIKSLSKSELLNMVKFVKSNYTPSNESLKWAKKMIGEAKSVRAKLLMYCNEIKK